MKVFFLTLFFLACYGFFIFSPEGLFLTLTYYVFFMFFPGVCFLTLTFYGLLWLFYVFSEGVFFKKKVYSEHYKEHLN